MEKIKSYLQKRTDPEHIIYILTILVLVTSLVASVLAWQAQKDKIREEGQNIFNAKVEAVTSMLNQRMTAYEEILRGSGAFIQTSDNLSLTNWQNFMDVSGAVTRYPGTNAIGFAPLVDKSSISTHVDLGQTLISDNYEVQNINNNLNSFVPLFYVQPLSVKDRNILGFDLYNVPQIKDALMAAQNSGDIQFTKPFDIEFPESDEEQEAILVILPVRSTTENFDGQIVSQDNIMGYVFLSINVNRLFADVVDTNTNNTFAFKITNQFNDSEIEIVKTSGFERIEQDWTHNTNRKISDTDLGWQIQYIANERFDENANALIPAYVLAGGIALSILFSGVFLYANLQRYEMVQKKKQEEIAEAKRDMVALTSHQLRTPATAVKQYIGMILEGYAGRVTNKEQLKFLKSAYESNEDQLETIDELLLVAKADAEQLQLNISRFDICKLTKKEISDQQSTIQSRDQKVAYTGRKSLNIYADRRMVKIIIENLISNASKYSDPQTTISVGIKKVENFCEVIVEDSGVGISSENFEKLFKKFSRIENKLSRKVSGSGIGLYLSKKLSELHGGNIAVKSIEGEGSKFILRLPINAEKNIKK